MLDRLNWVEINLKNYTHNIISIKKLIGPKVKLMAVVKANAYGHGVVEIAKTCEKLPVDYLGVVCLSEAKQLREARIKLPILILNYIDPTAACQALDLNVTVTVMDEDVLRKLDYYAGKKGKSAKIHVKIDTGMHRAGLLSNKALNFILKIKNYKNIYLEGIFTHFASSDEDDLTFTKFQNQIFKKILEKLEKKGAYIPLIHAANSGAVLQFSESYYDLVRPGIITYGLAPIGAAFKPKPVLSWKTKIIQIKKVKKGESVGYGRTFIAQKDTLVGLLPVGYGDGFRRSPKNWEFVLVKGKQVAILGRISMDQTSIDLTKIPNVKLGDEVVLIGKQNKEEITTEAVARRLGTICQEVTCAIASRVPRIYLT